MESQSLTKDEQALFASYEAAIHQGLETFIEVGNALARIRDARLYRADYESFEAYCKERWNLSKTHVNRMAAAAEVATDVAPIGVIPANEAQARPLAELPREERAEVWQEAVATAPNGKVTAKHVAATVARRTKPQAEPEPQIEPVAVIEEEPTPVVLSRGEEESQEIRDEFERFLSLVSDGGVYTLEAIGDAIGQNSQCARRFVFMCEVSPAVKVHRNYGRKGVIQFSFVRTNCTTAEKRIAQLAQQIIDDLSGSSRIHAAAAQILSLVGG